MKRSALALVAAVALGAGAAVPARGESLLPPPIESLLPPICIVPPLLLSCPPGTIPPPEDGSAEPPPAAVTPTEVRYDEHGILVRFRKGTGRRAIDAAFKRAGVTPKRVLAKIRFHSVLAPEGRRDEALASLRRERSVEAIERETLIDALDTQPDDPSWPDQWGLRRAGFPKAWDVTRGSPRTIVAVLDTGVDASHPDLQGAVGAGYDFVNRDSDPSDDDGHGTAVAGIIAARGNNGVGLTGACWACTIMPVKVLDERGTGDTAAVAAGMIWAADHGARVINLSLGGPGTTDALTAAVGYAIRKNVVIVAAAGNSGSVIPFYPATEPSVIGVAASNEEDRLYSWSNRGAWVEVAAPGCNISTWTGGAYVSFCGTSSATPLVSGLVALLIAARPQTTVQQAIDAVGKAVVPMPTGTDVRRGRVDAGQAVQQLAAAPRPVQTTTRTNLTLRGRLDRRTRSRIYKRAVGPGRVVMHLAFRPGLRLALWLSMPGRPLTRASGASPLRIVGTVPAGTIRVLVAGRPKRVSYRLTISYIKP
jgi:subtilisin family serine protease